MVQCLLALRLCALEILEISFRSLLCSCTVQKEEERNLSLIYVRLHCVRITKKEIRHFFELPFSVYSVMATIRYKGIHKRLVLLISLLGNFLTF